MKQLFIFTGILILSDVSTVCCLMQLFEKLKVNIPQNLFSLSFYTKLFNCCHLQNSGNDLLWQGKFKSQYCFEFRGHQIRNEKCNIMCLNLNKMQDQFGWMNKACNSKESSKLWNKHRIAETSRVSRCQVWPLSSILEKEWTHIIFASVNSNGLYFIFGTRQ